MINYKEYLDAGISVIPVDAKTKQPTIPWKKYQTELMSYEDAAHNFKNAVGLGVCGGCSGIEVIDIDNHFSDADEMLAEILGLLGDNNKNLESKLVIVQTQNGGYHLPFRTDAPEGNQKLAMRYNAEQKQDVLIETRGGGGYVVAPPTNGYKIIRGDYYTPPFLDDEERQLLLTVCRSFNEIEPDNSNNKPEPKLIEGLRPGDDFNAKTNIEDILLPHGWSVAFRSRGVTHFKRPGKQGHGTSATYNHIPNKLYVWSTASGLESNKTYSHFQVYTALNHNNDYKAAARDLGKQGYGTITLTDTLEKADENKKQTKGSIIQTLEDYLTDTCDLKYNLIRSHTEIKAKNESLFRPMQDRDVAEFWRYFNKNGYKLSKDIIENVLNSKFVAPYDPFIDYFDKLPKWDGTEHIKSYCDHIKVAPEQRELFLMVMERWAYAAVATAYGRATNHICPVFVGKQRIGKTTAIVLLFPEKLRDYCAADAHINPDDKDSKVMVAECFIINLDEFERSTKDEIGHLKSLITTTQITVRRPYGRRAETLTRKASFIASVNKNDFLNDITGNLRFAPIEFFGRDELFAFNVDQFWAEAKHFWLEGEKTYFNMDEYAELEKNSERFTVSTPEEEILLDKFEPYDCTGLNNEDLKRKEMAGSIKLRTNTELLSELQKQTTVRLANWKLGQILKKHNFEQRNIKYGKVTKRIYIVKLADQGEPF